MNKQNKYTNIGMRQDISNSKFENQYYFEGMNIRILSTNNQSSGAISNTKGNEFLLQIPNPFINYIDKTISYLDKTISYISSEIDALNNSEDPQIIIANCKYKKGFIIFTTNNQGLDCIWKLNEDELSLELLYIRNLNFNTNYPIQAINNYENNKIDKIYWVDRKEQLRFININHSIENGDYENLIDLPSSLLNIVSDIIFDNILIDDILYGGTHTSGMIQYAYSYYKSNGSESSLSPISNLIPLGKSVIQGGNLNEIVGTIPKILINNLDPNFTNLRLYSIKYTSLNVLPTVNIIADRDITGLNSFVYYDDGRVLSSVTLEDILFKYGRILIPNHIESKNNRLFLFNYKDRLYKLDQINNNLDTRAYSFPINSSSVNVFSSITDYDENTETVTGSYTTVDYTNNILNPNFLPYNHASINENYKLNKYLPNSNILGGEGYYLKYEIIRTTENNNNIYDYRFFKDNELYRIGIQFYNKYGLKSTPNWISDFVVTSNLNQDNLSGFYAGIKITLKPEFFVWLNTSSNFLDENNQYDEFLKPVGFKLLRADRTYNDKSIISQGFINGMLAISSETGYPSNDVDIERCNNSPKIPSLMRRFDNYLCPMFKNLTRDRLDKFNKSEHPQWKVGTDSDSSIESYKSSSSEDWRSSVYQFNHLMQFYSPDILFELINSVESSKIKVLGGIENTFNSLKVRKENWKDADFGDYKYINNAISTYDIKSSINNSEFSKRGIFGPAFISEDENRKSVATYQYFREYTGNFIKNQSNSSIYTIYGKPEVTSLNQGSKKYNDDSNLNYINNLETYTTAIAGANDSNLDNTGINSVVTQGSRCVTFALGEENINTENRPTIEQLFNESNIEPLINASQGGNNVTIVLNQVLTNVSDLTTAVFPNEYIGVLENNSIYYNNDKITVVGYFNSENVNLIFDSIANYDAAATATLDDWTNLKIAIVDNINNIIYTIVDQNLSLAGLVDTGDTFNYMDPLPLGSINQYVQTLSNLYSINTTSIINGYIVGVIDNLKKYEWNSVTESWSEIGSFILPPSDYKGGVALLIEFINDEKLKYIGNYYGGNSYESKTKTSYVEASNYFTLGNTTTSYIIVDPGDTFVQEYSLMRLSKNSALPDNSSLLRITELVKIRLESLVNQNKRNDESRFEWNEPWQPSQEDYHTYNRVYSQSSNILKNQDISYEVKTNDLYESSITASNFKRPGEVVDNWTKFDVLNSMYLEGKYGSINSVIKHNDEIFTFQDTAIAQISINPRVQIQGSDGINIKLGIGDLLDKYTYINTNTGTLNKWGVISTNSGIYYYDTINNSLNTISQNNKLSDNKHLHSFFQKNINNNIIKNDNHILKKGLQFTYDYLNNDVYFTFLQEENSLTINFNELQNEFVSLHSFKPSFYFNKGNIFLTSHPDNNNIYQHKDNIYNTFYNQYHPSYVIYNLNPEPDNECIFDNISFQSECYLNNVDQPLITINNIQCYNDYQNSGLVPLINGRNSNLRRKFRDWNAIIPRDERIRIRGPYSKLKLQFNNTNNYNLILHDIVLNYTS